MVGSGVNICVYDFHLLFGALRLFIGSSCLSVTLVVLSTTIEYLGIIDQKNDI